MLSLHARMQILPNGRVWLPVLVEALVDVVTGPRKSILVDKKLIDGPNANQRGKIWMPLVLLAQVFQSDLMHSHLTGLLSIKQS